MNENENKTTCALFVYELLSKPGSSTKQFSPKLAKKVRFSKMIFSSQPQYLTNLQVYSTFNQHKIYSRRKFWGELWLESAKFKWIFSKN